MKAKLLFHQKYVYPDGAIVEMKAWVVPKTAWMPEGFKYSLVYIDPDGRRILGFDNSERKGHHKHEKERQSPLRFESVEKLVKVFLNEIETIRRKSS